MSPLRITTRKVRSTYPLSSNQAQSFLLSHWNTLVLSRVLSQRKRNRVPVPPIFVFLPPPVVLSLVLPRLSHLFRVTLSTLASALVSFLPFSFFYFGSPCLSFRDVLLLPRLCDLSSSASPFVPPIVSPFSCHPRPHGASCLLPSRTIGVGLHSCPYSLFPRRSCLSLSTRSANGLARCLKQAPDRPNRSPLVSNILCSSYRLDCRSHLHSALLRPLAHLLKPRVAPFPPDLQPPLRLLSWHFPPPRREQARP